MKTRREKSQWMVRPLKVNANTASNEVRGVGMDSQTRCVHYNSELDVVAIRMCCCREYFACKDCHLELADHAIEVWPRDQWEERAVRCGACRGELTISEYMKSGNECPGCHSGFNPGCRTHYYFYFAI